MKRLLRSILIGKKIVLDGNEGKIIDETQNMLTLEMAGRRKKIIKKCHRMTIDGYDISGEDLVGKPQARIKKKFR